MSEPSKEQPQAEEPKISPAELKKRAKAEKQARRAAQKDQQGGESSSQPIQNGVPREQKQDGPQKQQGQKQKGQPQPKQAGQAAQPQQAQHRRTGSQGAQQMPIREKGGKSAMKGPKKESKHVELFSHLYTQTRRHTAEGVSKDVHPSVLALGFKISSYEICGSNARCVAMLLAFKDAIQEYTTPAGTTLARHMTSHLLSPQIEFLRSCRPISESMGNSIRWLKKLIVEIDPDTAEQEAKDYLCENIDRFIQERVTVTDQAIASSARQQIRHGSVVLTFAKSSIVEQTILQAHAHGTRFRVMVVDSRPLFEGRNLATSLMRAGLEVEYVPFSGIAHAVKEATVVLLGAHAMLSNGRLQSRIGTASVAMQAHRAAIPVIVCCESVKFSGKVALDSIVLNEVAAPEELLVGSSFAPPPRASAGGDAGAGEEGPEKREKVLADWRDIQNLQLLSLMHDVTPAEYISMIICEYGTLPPSSVPVVHRLANESGLAA